MIGLFSDLTLEALRVVVVLVVVVVKGKGA